MTIWVPPCGATPLGAFTGTFSGPLPAPPVIRADKLDPKDSVFLSMAGDQDPVDAAVVEALWRVRGSGAAVADKGARFLDVRKLDDGADRLLESQARNALLRLVQRGDITINRIIVTHDGGDGTAWAEVAVHYLNNRAPKDKMRVKRVRVPEAVHG